MPLHMGTTTGRARESSFLGVALHRSVPEFPLLVYESILVLLPVLPSSVIAFLFPSQFSSAQSFHLCGCSHSWQMCSIVQFAAVHLPLPYLKHIALPAAD